MTSHLGFGHSAAYADCMGLARAIEQLYGAFQDMPRPTAITHESWELQEGEVKQLTTSPLCEIPSALMRSYLSDAVYNVGTWDDFRYFLPRLLELAQAREVALEQIGQRIEYARERGYSLEIGQRQALRDFAVMLWDDLLSVDALEAERALSWETMEPFGVTRAELLGLWQRHAAGARALAQVLISNGRLPPEWPRDEVLDWLQTAFFDESNSEMQRMLSDVILILEAVPEPLKSLELREALERPTDCDTSSDG